MLDLHAINIQVLRWWSYPIEGVRNHGNSGAATKIKLCVSRAHWSKIMEAVTNPPLWK